MGTAVFAHIVSFFSVTYFDQIRIFWYLLLAGIATVSIFPSKDNAVIDNTQNNVKSGSSLKGTGMLL